MSAYEYFGFVAKSEFLRNSLVCGVICGFILGYTFYAFLSNFRGLVIHLQDIKSKSSLKSE